MFEALLSYLMGLSVARFLLMVEALLSDLTCVIITNLARFLLFRGVVMFEALRNSVFCIFLASGAS